MLNDKFLGNLEYGMDNGVHNLELLNICFGEVSMRQCEVIIKDINDLDHIHANIPSTLAQP